MFSLGVELGWAAGSLAAGSRCGSGGRPLLPGGKALSLDLSCCGPACSQELLAAESLGGGSANPGGFLGACLYPHPGPACVGTKPRLVPSRPSHLTDAQASPPVFGMRITASSLF